MTLHTALNIDNLTRQANDLGRQLMAAVTVSVSRKHFIGTLAQLLHAHFHFDRLCINLYDHEGGMLTYFTAAEGTVISTLSPVRPADASSTVAGHVIASGKPVVITDFGQYFSASTVHPVVEAGLNATMAFPLLLDNEIFATLHCSFAEKPENIYEITSFLVELCPPIAICLGAILSLEHMRHAEGIVPLQSLLSPSSEDRVVCHSKAMRAVMRQVDAVAKLNVPVLLLGETGTGKSLLAQDIHRRSRRQNGHFVKVNCPSLPQSLFESELFGHAKGSFTGAVGKRVGRFELAHGGTLFLDEIAELSPEMQSKLLQVLEDASFERVGESVPLVVDVRIVAATNAHVGQMLHKGTLRPDLFYRLSACTIELPPLRQRAEDMEPLVAALAAHLAVGMGLPVVKLKPALLAPLRDYDWPGNVRELRNVVSKLIIHHSVYGELNPALVRRLLEESRALLAPATVESELAPTPAAVPAPQCHSAGLSLAEAEKKHILDVLRRTNHVLAGPQGAAALLGLPRSTLQHRLRKLGITVGEGKEL